MNNQNKKTFRLKGKPEDDLSPVDLKQNDSMLQELINLSPDLFFRIDLKGFFEYLSPSAKNLFADIKKKGSAKTLLIDNPTNQETLEKIILRSKQGEFIAPFRLEFLGKDGKCITLEIQGKPIEGNGKVIAYAGIAHDISSLIKAEAVIKKQNNRAQRELDLAAQVHLTLIPPNFENEQVSIAINYLPVSGVGGDYTNYKLLNDGSMIFIICDVTGHGVPAALLVNRLDSEFERLAKAKPQPGKLLNKFNNFIKEYFEGTRMYLSAFCGHLNFSTMKLTYSNYGHPPQMLFQTMNSEISSLAAQTHLVGLTNQKPSTVFEEKIDIRPGDRIICYTDGVIEADGSENEMFGYDRLKGFILKNTMHSNFEFNEKLIQEAEDFTNDGFNDDICVLSIDIKAQS